MPRKYTSPFLARNLEITRLIDLGEYTLQELSERYNITRERIRQIHFHYSHTGAKAYQARNREVAENIKKIEGLQTKFICAECGARVTNGDLNLRKYCRACHNWLRKEQRDGATTLSCLYCHKPFHPHRNTKYNKLGHSLFCTQRCYWDAGGINYAKNLSNTTFPLDEVRS